MEVCMTTQFTERFGMKPQWDWIHPELTQTGNTVTHGNAIATVVADWQQVADLGAPTGPVGSTKTIGDTEYRIVRVHQNRGG
jgi:hypothetical protein